MIAKARLLVTAAVVVPTLSSAALAQTSAGDAPAPASAATLDPGIRRMIETAIAQGDRATVQSVLAVARQAAPDAKDEIDREEEEWRKTVALRTRREDEERRARLRQASVLDYWKGEVEIGASRATGNSVNFGLLGAIDLKREGLEWTHQLTARADVQSADERTTTERIIAAWQPNYRFDEKGYAYGLAQFEHDPFAGYAQRYTLGGGLGWRAITTRAVKLELEGGPALRREYAVDGGAMSHVAGRGSLNLAWKITPTLSLSQKTAVYLEAGDGNVVANTALDTKLIGNLKARFSYNVQYERNPPIGTAMLNTQSRATFVYGF